MTAGTHAAAPPADPPDTATGRSSQRRLLPMLLIGNTAVFALYLGVAQILLPLQVEAIDPADKVTNLGIITGIGAAFATVLQPIGGALSDRTRSRFGRRNPWMLGGALAALAFMMLMGSLGSIAMLVVGWALAQGAGNLYQAALTAIVPDRVPRERRGLASAMVGAGTMLAAVLGGLIASRFVDDLETGYFVLGALLVAAAVLMVTLTRDPRPGELPDAPAVPAGAAEGGGLRSFLSALGDHDFRWVFIGRALMILSYFMILGYLLYMLKDHIGVPEGMAATDAVVVLGMISSVVALVSTLVGGPLSDRLDRRRIFVLVAGIGMTVTLLLPLLVPTWTAMVVFMAVNGVFFGVYMAVDTSIVTLVLPAGADAGRDMAVLNIANAGPQIVSPFVAALVITFLGGYSALFVVAAVLAALGALAILPVKSVR